MPRKKSPVQTVIDVAILTMLVESMPHKLEKEWKSLAAAYNKLVQPGHKSNHLHLCNYWKRWNRKEVNDALLARLVEEAPSKVKIKWREIAAGYNQQERVKKTSKQLRERYVEHLDPETRSVSGRDYGIIQAFIDKNPSCFIESDGKIGWTQLSCALLKDEEFKQAHMEAYGRVFKIRANSLKNSFISRMKEAHLVGISNDSDKLDEGSPGGNEIQPESTFQSEGVESQYDFCPEQYVAPQESSPMTGQPAHCPPIFCDDVWPPPSDETLLSIWQGSNSNGFEQGDDELLREAVVVPRTSQHCFFIPETPDPESIFNLSDTYVSAT